MTDAEKVEKYKDVARDIHDYINTAPGISYGFDDCPVTEESLLAAIAKIDDWLEQIWLDK